MFFFTASNAVDSKAFRRGHILDRRGEFLAEPKTHVGPKTIKHHKTINHPQYDHKRVAKISPNGNGRFLGYHIRDG